MNIRLLSKSRFVSTLYRTFTSSTEKDSVLKTSTVPQLLNHQDYNISTKESPRQAWIESLSTIEENRLGFISLHPDIFGTLPRFDTIHENVVWQKNYKLYTKSQMKDRYEKRGGGRKPWPQKGTGRARQSSIRAPHWIKGGICHGPRSYMTKYYMLSFSQRVRGLISMLSCKFAQDDLKIVDTLDIPSNEPGYLQQLFNHRFWGPDVLFINLEDVVPENITLATETLGHVNVIPYYSLNVHCMLKHQTLVMTVPALQKIEGRLLYQLNRTDAYYMNVRVYDKRREKEY